MSPTVAICANVPFAPVLRSILNPVSLPELSCQTSDMLFCDNAVATRLLGEAGIGSGSNCALNTAVTEVLALTDTLQMEPTLLVQPNQPMNVELLSAMAVSAVLV